MADRATVGPRRMVRMDPMTAGDEKRSPCADYAPLDAVADATKARHRATSLGPHDYLLLDQWGRQLREAFGQMPYLVGSVIRASRDWRDVDVRMLVPEDAGWLVASKRRLRALNLSVTLWGRQVTGLPIDFQIQPATEFHTYDSERRGALGIRTALEAQEDDGSPSDG